MHARSFCFSNDLNRSSETQLSDDLCCNVFNRRYTYDKASNLIQSADQRSGVLHYVYDKIGRIQEARNSQTGRSETFAFDPAHNTLSDKAAEGKGNNLTGGNRLKEYNGIEYTYDALGNLIYRQLPDGENQYYQYDLENQLVRAEIKKPAGNTEIWTYAYDPFGRRLSKERQDKLAWTSTDPKRTHFVWDGTRLLQEYTYKGSYTYIYTDQDSYEPLARVFHLGLKVIILTYIHILKPDKVTDVKELKHQIRGQIRAFNKILKTEGLEGLQERIRNFRDDPTIEARGRRYTSDKGSAGEGMVWLHEPDMCAGGAPESADRKGKSRENSIIGPNSSRISDEILKLKPSDEITKFRSKLILKNNFEAKICIMKNLNHSIKNLIMIVIKKISYRIMLMRICLRN